MLYFACICPDCTAIPSEMQYVNEKERILFLSFFCFFGEVVGDLLCEVAD